MVTQKPINTEGSFFLVVSEGVASEQRFPLHPDQITDIGRAGTNRVVLRDDICSRNHCEIFHISTGWMLRDRSSRNGTYLNETRVDRDRPLVDGDIIRIGETLMLFTTDESASLKRRAPRTDSDTATDLRIPDESAALPEIIHRQKHSSLRDRDANSRTIDKSSSAKLSRLYQIAIKMGDATSSQELADIVLDGLVGITGADIGAVLTQPSSVSRRKKKVNSTSDLIVTSYRSLEGQPYHKVSTTLTRDVLKSGEAILARDISIRADLSSRDSLEDMQAQSLVIAPVLDGSELFGLIHLYSTNPENPLDANGLDYTLAVADQLAIALKSLLRQQDLQDGLQKATSENKQLREQLAIESELVGSSEAMDHLRETIGLVAPTDTAVLIRGESGSGKELVARAIHFNSKRKEGPFVCMNCAALSESLLESELFGHERGAFTGATGLKHGKFEQGHQGTLFLDEVGEMSPAIQAKFLRVLEGHSFERVGGSVPINVNVRLVAATNRDLERAVRENLFRKDLYFRLQVLEITVPALRERMEDVPILAEFFAQRFANKSGRRTISFTDAAMKKLTRYEWPGNVRELQNTVERAVVLCVGDTIQGKQILLSRLDEPELNEILPQKPPQSYAELSIEEIERDHILRTLESTEGNKSKAAQILGIERSTLDRKLKKYGLKIIRD